MTISSWPLQREVFNLFQQVIVNLSSSPRSSIAMRHHQNHNVCHLPHVNQQTLQHRKCLQMVQQIENVSDHIAPFLSLFVPFLLRVRHPLRYYMGLFTGGRWVRDSPTKLYLKVILKDNVDLCDHFLFSLAMSTLYIGGCVHVSD